ncbi:hypothetical protein [Thiomicrorhabdus indica]|uniref:hypothetical protein n=1 Tax=Thiomicrorhabdus indica TaxID=2267253 RepID=UPI00102DABA7|nr:hypothetical protein [Thiomicrorhabdus indica]
MWKFNDKVWTYWLITDALLILDVFGWAYGLIAASVLTAIQVIHFRVDTGRASSFPVQVRIAYLLLLMAALWPPLYWLIYPVILGTTAMVLVDYCFLARFMSIMPWNLNQPYSFNMIYKTFFSKPVSGSVQKTH